jgi:ABC-2 type transport system permease protein
MPAWLQAIAQVNPLTYEVDGLRALMVINGTSVYGFALDLGFLLLATALLIIAAARLYPRVVI